MLLSSPPALPASRWPAPPGLPPSPDPTVMEAGNVTVCPCPGEGPALVCPHQKGSLWGSLEKRSSFSGGAGKGGQLEPAQKRCRWPPGWLLGSGWERDAFPLRLCPLHGGLERVSCRCRVFPRPSGLCRCFWGFPCRCSAQPFPPPQPFEPPQLPAAPRAPPWGHSIPAPGSKAPGAEHSSAGFPLEKQIIDLPRRARSAAPGQPVPL